MKGSNKFLEINVTQGFSVAISNEFQSYRGAVIKQWLRRTPWLVLKV